MNAVRTKHLSSGFSLTELILAIAMVLLLMYGVITIFKSTSDAIGKGMAVGDLTRNEKAVLNTLPVDFAGFKRSDTDVNQKDASPFLWIQNQVVSAPLDKNTPTSVSRRVDMVGMIVKGGNYKSQSPNFGRLSSDLNVMSDVAYISYGQLWLPDTTGAFLNVPLGDGTGVPTVGAGPTADSPQLPLCQSPNYVASTPGYDPAVSYPNHYYARNWILGRTQIILKTSTGNPPGAPNGAQDYYYDIDPPSLIWSPISNDSVSTTINSSGETTVYSPYQSRYDLARTNISRYTNSDPIAYFRAKVDSSATVQPTGIPATVPMTTSYWLRPLVYRYQADPNPTQPMVPTVAGQSGGSAKMARTLPMLLEHCTDFRVEFAGDFVKQDTTTGVFTTPVDPTTPTNYDGLTDFDIVNGVRKIHWYGAGTGVVGSSSPGPVPGAAGTWEFVRQSTLSSAQYYRCAWGNPNTTAAPRMKRPQMLRFSLTIHDTNSRLVDGQNYQYIVRLQD